MPTSMLGMAASEPGRPRPREASARAPGRQRPTDAVLYLQRAYGNRAVARMARESRALSRRPTAEAKGAAKPAPTASSARTATELAELARLPGDAHRAWKRLSPTDREAVIRAMAGRYGREFADRFRPVAEHGKPDYTLTYWQLGVGPSPERLTADGWRRAGMDVTGNASIDVEVWVHPTGKVIRRDVSGGGWTPVPETIEPPPPCGQEFAALKARMWPAMSAFDVDVESLEADPQASDRASTEARIERERKAVRDMIRQLSDLADEFDEDDPCAAEISDEWTDAMEQYTSILARYNGIRRPDPDQAAP